jgi:uncharacterized protein with von Willebrand factor type A (vWA) domain
VRLAAVIIALLAGIPARACDVGLVLVFDLSASVGEDERLLTLHGIAEALRHPYVEGAFLGQSARVRVVAFADRAAPLTEWISVQSPADLHAIAGMLDAPPTISIGTSTTINSGLALAAQSLGEVDCAREVVDVMTDGEDQRHADMSVFGDGATVNVLLVGSDPTGALRAAEMQRGLGSFTWPLTGLDDLTNALARKIAMEVS